MRVFEILFCVLFLVIACKPKPPVASGLSGVEYTTVKEQSGGISPENNYSIIQVNDLKQGDYEFGNRKPYIQFDLTNESLNGNAGCNQINGKFKKSGDTLILGKIASTRMMCPAMAFEQQVLGILNEGKLIIEQVNNSSVILTSAKGKITLAADGGN